MKIYRIDFTMQILLRGSPFWFLRWHNFEENLNKHFPWRDDSYGFRLCGIGFELTVARQTLLYKSAS